MIKHFVEFLSPGTFVSESTTKEISEWSVIKASEMATKIKERHGAIPYGFRFLTRERGEQDLDSKVIDTSGIYYLGGKVLTLEQVKARKDPKDSILISNMEINKIDRIIENTNSYKITLPLGKKDTVLDWG